MKALEVVGNGNILVKRNEWPCRKIPLEKSLLYTLGHLATMVTQLANKPNGHLQTHTLTNRPVRSGAKGPSQKSFDGAFLCVYGLARYCFSLIT